MVRAARVLAPIGAAALLAVASGCVGEAPLAQPPEVDRARFEVEVYPVLLRDCGFPACHGNPVRFFRVFGPGRTRLDPATGLYAAPTTAEIDASFDRARSMLSGAPEPGQSTLLRKPLEPSEGGAAHTGVDALGRNVYASREDPGWRAIAAWAGETIEPRDGGAEDADAGDGSIDDASVDGEVGDGGEADAAIDAAAEDAS